MARPISAAMKRAEQMVKRKRHPLTGAEAARRNGLSEQALYKSRWWKEWLQVRNDVKQKDGG